MFGWGWDRVWDSDDDDDVLMMRMMGLMTLESKNKRQNETSTYPVLIHLALVALYPDQQVAGRSPVDNKLEGVRSLKVIQRESRFVQLVVSYAPKNI